MYQIILFGRDARLTTLFGDFRPGQIDDDDLTMLEAELVDDVASRVASRRAQDRSEALLKAFANALCF